MRKVYSFVSQRVKEHCPDDAENAIVLRPSIKVYEVYVIQGDNRTIGVDAFPDDTGIFKDRLYVDTDYDEPVSRGFYCDALDAVFDDTDHATVILWNLRGEDGRYSLERAGTVAIAGRVALKHLKSRPNPYDGRDHSIETLYPEHR